MACVKRIYFERDCKENKVYNQYLHAVRITRTVECPDYKDPQKKGIHGDICPREQYTTFMIKEDKKCSKCAGVAAPSYNYVRDFVVVSNPTVWKAGKPSVPAEIRAEDAKRRGIPHAL